ncbi:hypothetical protein A4X13_0g8169 [Tilletia indica]|uniref:Tyr recombinase domain-containing protein n=1 Tax=Tilletia indica TaxID=43049 RepID=A0A177T732_9BASI|nr:hypothetical protein A4X13_0g8169 [Tilletia indica]
MSTLFPNTSSPSSSWRVPPPVSSAPARSQISPASSAALPLPLPTSLPHTARRLPAAPSGQTAVSAADRLLLWVPPGSSLVSARDPAQRQRVLAAAWAASTRSTYGTGLLRWLLWCDHHHIPEAARFPVGLKDLVDFIDSLAGTFAGSSIRNWVSGIRAWHIIHGATLDTTNPRVTSTLRGADRLTPPSSIAPPRAPFRISHLWTIRKHLTLEKPADAAIWACLLVAFWGLARLGELVVKSGPFDGRRNPTCAALKWEPVSKESPMILAGVITLPWTKTQPNGEKVVLAPQMDSPCPVRALRNHLVINQPPHTGHLFGYRGRNRFTPLTRSVFTSRINGILRTAGLSKINLKGHSLRVGGCTEFLLRGVAIDTVRLHGRWSSEAWRLYLRQHVELLAPALMDTIPTTASSLVTMSSPSHFAAPPPLRLQSAPLVAVGPSSA